MMQFFELSKEMSMIPIQRTATDIATKINIAPLIVKGEIYMLYDMGLLVPMVNRTINQSIFGEDIYWFPKVDFGEI